MNDPKRLWETSDPFERTLLDAGRGDAISPQRRRALIATFGVGVPLAPLSELRSSVEVTSKLDFPPPTPELHVLPSLASSGSGLLSGNALLATLGAGGAAALAVWAAVATQETSAPDATPPSAPLHFEIEQAPREPDPPTAPPVEVEPTPDQLAPEPEEATPTPVRRSGAHDKSDGLAAELAIIDGARSALTRRDASGSLRQLDDYARQYPKGRLRSEATLLRIQALSASGNRAAAERLGKAELARSPNGPYARKIRSLIEGPSSEP